MWCWYLFLVVILQTVLAVSGSGFRVPPCPRGKTRLAGSCIPSYNDYDDYDVITEAPPDCECVKSHLCPSAHVVGKPRTPCPDSKVCCWGFSVQDGEIRDRDSGCGWSETTNETGPLGDAAYGEFPWVVVILKESAGEFWSHKEHVAGGALIHPRVVLTAAHKLDGYNATQLKCRAGEWSRNESEPQPYQQRYVRALIKHEGYSRKYVSNSIALVFLHRPFDTSHGAVRVACVGLKLPPEDAVCFATGWGRKSYGGEYAHRLKKISVPVSHHHMCQGSLRLTRLGSKFTLHSSAFCAGGVKGVDTCTGDGGSPLLYKIAGNSSHSRYAVVGLAAWGVGCGASGVPAVYVHVPQFLPWLRDVMAARGLYTSSFSYAAVP